MIADPKKTVLVVGTGASVLAALIGQMKPATIGDRVDAAPCVSGPKGRAWRVDIAAILAKVPAAKRGQDATLGVWVVEAPWAHPVWHSYVIGLAHLRPIEGGPPAHIHLDGATHEFWLWAANPTTQRQLFIVGAIGINEIVLSPTNFGAQLRCPSDSAATRLIEIAAQEICDGKLNPDTDAFGQWIERFGDNLIKPEFKPKRNDK